MHLKRWITGLSALPFLIFLVYIGGFPFIILIGFACICSLWEYFRIVFNADSEIMNSVVIWWGYFVGLAVVVYAGLRLDVSFGPFEMLAGIAAVACGFTIYLAVFLLLTCVSFWVEDRVGIIPPVYNLLTFGRYPLDIYNPLIKLLLSWVIPFGFAAFYPSARFLGHEEYASYFFAMPFVAAAFLSLAVVVWNRGVRNYASTGS